MESSVSPLPLPLWPLVALSLTLFVLTAAAVTVSGHYTKQLYASSSQNSPEVAAPTLASLQNTNSPRANSRPIF